MPEFKIGDTHETTAPTITVENLLKRGEHVFRLWVMDDSGNKSEPVDVTVTIRDLTKPLAKVRVLPSETIEAGDAFTLDGSLSSDPAQGTIVKYIWTRVS